MNNLACCLLLFVGLPLVLVFRTSQGLYVLCRDWYSDTSKQGEGNSKHRQSAVRGWSSPLQQATSATETSKQVCVWNKARLWQCFTAILTVANMVRQKTNIWIAKIVAVGSWKVANKTAIFCCANNWRMLTVCKTDVWVLANAKRFGTVASND